MCKYCDLAESLARQTGIGREFIQDDDILSAAAMKVMHARLGYPSAELSEQMEDVPIDHLVRGLWYFHKTATVSAEIVLSQIEALRNKGIQVTVPPFPLIIEVTPASN